jgi:hypothetical protein
MLVPPGRPTLTAKQELQLDKNVRSSPAVKHGTKLQPNRSSSHVYFRGRYLRRTLTRNTALRGKSQFSLA